MYVSTFYVLTHSFVKKGHLLWAVQKDKKTYFITEFYHFYIGHIKSLFFLEPLHGHLKHGDVHITFLFGFLTFSNMLKIHFK
jgi:hypothetical protein